MAEKYFVCSCGNDILVNETSGEFVKCDVCGKVFSTSIFVESVVKED